MSKGLSPILAPLRAGSTAVHLLVLQRTLINVASKVEDSEGRGSGDGKALDEGRLGVVASQVDLLH